MLPVRRQSTTLLVLFIFFCLPVACVPVSDEDLQEPDVSSPSPSPTPGQTPSPTPSSSPAVDRDGDGYSPDEDCDDTDAQIYPGADELCDEVDNDCDEEVDEEVVTIAYYLDFDQDGYGTPNNTVVDCKPPFGYTNRGGDCDDTSATNYPGAEEVCDGVDNDCDDGQAGGGIDEGVSTTYYRDGDHDGYGDSGQEESACLPPGEGYSEEAGDCDDTNPGVYPGAVETCDGIDQDCDEVVDNVQDTVYYHDQDGDGFGAAEDPVLGGCSPGPGLVAVDGDCNDGNADVHPGAFESCNNQVDDNCDGVVDEGSLTDFYPDEDGDGFGADDRPAVSGCTAGDGYAANALDCDDSDKTVHPMWVDKERGSSSGEGTPDKPYREIQRGIDARGSCDLVLVNPGTYTESLSVNSHPGLIIRTEGDPGLVIVRNPGQDRILLINDSPDAQIEGLTVQGNSPVSKSGAGIAVIGSDGVVLSNLLVRDMIADGKNIVGGGIAIANSKDVVVQDTSVINNKADSGGGLACSGCTVRIVECEFSNNSANVYGGGAYTTVDPILERQETRREDFPELTIEWSHFYQNSAGDTGGGVFSDQGHTLELLDSSFEENLAGNRAGAANNPISVERCWFADNQASGPNILSYYGGALVLRTTSEVKNSIFMNNLAVYGGAIDIYAFPGETAYQTLVNNTFVDNSADMGASIYIFNTTNITLSGNIIVHFADIDHTAIHNIQGDLAYTISYNDFYIPGDGAVFGGQKLPDSLLNSYDNFEGDPMFVCYPPNAEEEVDLHLLATSPNVDTGNPLYGNDADSSPPDRGAYGGPTPFRLP